MFHIPPRLPPNPSVASDSLALGLSSRWLDYEKIYEVTERQVKQGETELLYEIAYDLVIL